MGTMLLIAAVTVFAITTFVVVKRVWLLRAPKKPVSTSAITQVYRDQATGPTSDEHQQKAVLSTEDAAQRKVKMDSTQQAASLSSIQAEVGTGMGATAKLVKADSVSVISTKQAVNTEAVTAESTSLHLSTTEVGIVASVEKNSVHSEELAATTDKQPPTFPATSVGPPPVNDLPESKAAVLQPKGVHPPASTTQPEEHSPAWPVETHSPESISIVPQVAGNKGTASNDPESPHIGSPEHNPATEDTAQPDKQPSLQHPTAGCSENQLQHEIQDVEPSDTKSQDAGNAPLAPLKLPVQEPTPDTSPTEAASAGTIEEYEAPTKRRRIIQIHPTDETNQKPDRTKSQPAISVPRERKARVYDPPDISECLNSASDAYSSKSWLEYRKWNRALASFFLLNFQPAATVYLTVTPRLLAAAWQKTEGATLQPENASNNFANAVGTLYEHEVLSRTQGLKILKCSAPDNAPLCTGLLGLAVLAAYTMRTDGGYSANAYYARLADLLVGHRKDNESLPFDQDEYYALWAYLQYWIRQRTGATLPLPARDESARFYVALALSHVPLRQVDTERLPRFFLSAKYGPSERPPTHQLDTALRHWCAGHRRFTDAGMDAINDERRPAVLSQIAHELQIWDGTGEDEQGQTNANIELLLEFRNRQPSLSYSARCPVGFPRSFETQQQILQSTEGGWYDQKAVLTADGPQLLEGFTWKCDCNGTTFVLRRPPAKAIAFVTQEHSSALMSHSGLLVGGKCAVMCLDELAGSTAQYLTGACGRKCDPCKPQGFPDGWTLFVGISVCHSNISLPAGLESLAPDSTVRILCVGGLKVGCAYLKDAPPKICITGMQSSPGEISVDQKPVEIDSDGYVIDSAPLLHLGLHTISAGTRNKSIEIVDSDLAPRLAVHPAMTDDHAKSRFSTFAATPPGFWHILGAGIGDVGEPCFARSQGTLMQCNFQPVWAICCQSRKSPKIVCLLEQPQLPQRLSRTLVRKVKSQKKLRKYAARWASILRFANHPRALIICANGGETPQYVVETWGAYKRAAREVARHILKT